MDSPADDRGTERHRLRAVLGALLLLMVLMPGRLRAQEIAAGAELFVAQLGQDLRAVAAMNPEDDGRFGRFKHLFLQAFDVGAIGRFSVGRYWHSSTERQQSEFMALFADQIVVQYARRFARYADERIQSTAAESLGEDHAIVTTDFLGSGRDNIQWRILRREGGLKIVDILINGVSLSTIQQADFMSVIHRAGGDMERLLALLRDRAGAG
jgi:phospholipid transport system substrate-binding protein